MHPSTLLIALAAPAALAHIAPRETMAMDHGAMDSAPAASPTHIMDMDDDTMDDDTMSHMPTPTPTTTTPKQPSAYADLAKCELGIDTLLKAFNMVPTPNAALSAFLATETVHVTDPCSWAADVPSSLSGAYSAYSSNLVGMLEDHAEIVTELVSCVAAGGASVTRAEIVTPLFALPGCEGVSTTAGAGASSTGAVGGAGGESSTKTNGFPVGESSTAGAARQTGMAVAGVVGVALLGVAGAF